MSELLTPTKADHGWVITMPSEMARDAGVPEGSMVLMYPANGTVITEILPPATPELKDSVHRIADKLQDAFAEMKRRGD